MPEADVQQQVFARPEKKPRLKRPAVIAVIILAAAAAAVFAADRTLTGVEVKSGSSGTLPAIVRGYCGLRGGQMIVTGCGLANCLESCQMILRNAGNACASSKECGGRCLLDVATGVAAQLGAGVLEPPSGCSKNGAVYQCAPDLGGRCASFRRLPNCQSNFELLGGGVIRQVSDGCRI